jgi:4-hydroxybenzoyl-CoA thioesterase
MTSAVPGRAVAGEGASADLSRVALDGQAFRTERRIRFSDCDPAGIVFYPLYFVMLNGLVEDWVDALGIGYQRLVIQRRVGLPTVRLEADFRAVSHFGDPVVLTLQVVRLGGRSLTLQLRCEGAAGDTRMSVRQVIVTTSLDSHAAIDIPDDLRDAIQRSGCIADS